MARTRLFSARLGARSLFTSVGPQSFLRRLGPPLAACFALAAVLSFAGASSGPARAASAPPPVGSRIPWLGQPWYLHGVNVPWVNWGCDFGCGASGGVSDPAVAQQLSNRFATLASSGVHVARWWVFEGTAWQITRDAAGAPLAVDPRVYADLDAALVLADRYDLYYELTLFHGPANVPASWLADPVLRARLVTALTPLFQRYASHPRVLAFDVMNEPEWDIWNGAIAAAPVQETVRAIAAAVHASGNAYVTVGSAMLDGLPLWKGLGLDYYQAHWYDYMTPGQWCARCTDYAEIQRRYGLDRPLVIGEFYAGADVDTLQRLEDWRAKGYAGAFAWSLFTEKTTDGMAIAFGPMATFAARYGDVGPRRTAATATATPAATTATATATASASPTTIATALATATSSPAATSTPPPPTATSTSALPLPPRLLQTQSRKDAVRLEWVGSATAGATYRIYRGTAPGTAPGAGSLLASGLTGTRFDDRSVVPGTVYYYRVTAVTTAGESAMSNEASGFAR